MHLAASYVRITLFNHLVSNGKQGRWNREADRLGNFEVYDQLVFGRLLHGQVGRLLALEDAINVGGRTAKQVGRIRTIRN